ncbi:MAG: bifunctional oligoribonuclease/PAP phosphatase NrnA [Clostridium sp.]|uniref:DHH family phosphoesterase n=1 Tax=Clostridium sp. DSM 8431 TaxID=1761781 RepID=UPI0008E8D47D|nr:bifunctional oligoribonuclease/PAP phosphatase NrnA [Clostridium sp. DSM 8431]MCR4944068.1 bifunctional oligoribonuclease/PAP phosphatase NrnA [Clostridium sp.]SFU44274.1 phosphoesterase RecJ domain-containing protein [Clostridium sp. DSM 8431]
MALQEISKVILNSSKIGLTFHASPDGDAIGSTLGLLNGLREMGKDAYIISEEVIPDYLSFLPLSEEINKEVLEPLPGTDLVIVLDCGNVERICADLKNYDNTIMNIDHHLSNDMYGEYNYVDTNASATSEIVFELLKELKFEFAYENEILKNIAMCLYTGIVTDTGSFRHSNVTVRTHKIAAELIGCGINNSYIHNELFGNKPLNKLKLTGEAINILEVHFDGKVSFVELSLKTLEKFNMLNSDTSDIINMILNVEGIEVAVVTKETEDGVKASLRSKNDFDVRKIAEIFGGGGHTKASGLKIKDASLAEAKERILKAIGKEI